MEYFIIIIVAVIVMGILLFLFKGSKKEDVKSAYLKKEEIIFGFKNELKTLLEENRDLSSNELQEKKMQFIKQAHNKLHNNIFFSDEEVKKIIQELAHM